MIFGAEVDGNPLLGISVAAHYRLTMLYHREQRFLKAQAMLTGLVKSLEDQRWLFRKKI